MKFTAPQIAIIGYVIQMDENKAPRTYGTISELTNATEVFKQIKKCTKDNVYVEGELKLTSELKVFLNSLIDSIKWDVNSGETVLEVKELLK